MPNVVLLDRVVTGTLPDYCTHGYASCVMCREMCWMGHATSQVIESGDAVPLCLDCAPNVIPPGTHATVNLADHKRADGPHD